MSIKRWFYLFLTSLLVGVIAAVAVGMYFQITDPELKVLDGSVILMNVLAGLTFSILSQMGFFAYLMLNYIARTMFRNRYIWMTIQWILIVIVFFDLVYLRFLFFDEQGRGITGYLIFPIILAVASIIVTLWKVRLTNSGAFTPTLFLMFFVTAIESIPALRENNPDTILFMVIPVFCCNAWQILNLHRMVEEPESNVEKSKA